VVRRPRPRELEPRRLRELEVDPRRRLALLADLRDFCPLVSPAMRRCLFTVLAAISSARDP
jgi:hypothetical protein